MPHAYRFHPISFGDIAYPLREICFPTWNIIHLLWEIVFPCLSASFSSWMLLCAGLFACGTN
ncbi:MAG: hypothetical protein LBQ60_06940 [Bacteroidales bacterium]|nr:hypothetical protein [Bacteroidales bacterium]